MSSFPKAQPSPLLPSCDPRPPWADCLPRPSLPPGLRIHWGRQVIKAEEQTNMKSIRCFYIHKYKRKNRCYHQILPMLLWDFPGESDPKALHPLVSNSVSLRKTLRPLLPLCYNIISCITRTPEAEWLNSAQKNAVGCFHAQHFFIEKSPKS